MKFRHPSGDESLLSAADTVSMYMWYIVIKSDQIFYMPALHACIAVLIFQNWGLIKTNQRLRLWFGVVQLNLTTGRPNEDLSAPKVAPEVDAEYVVTGLALALLLCTSSPKATNSLPLSDGYSSSRLHSFTIFKCHFGIKSHILVITPVDQMFL